jgi:hypothetical protein
MFKNFLVNIKNSLFPVSSALIEEINAYRKSANDLINVQKRYIVETEKNYKNMIAMLRYVCRSSAAHIREGKPIDEALKILDLAGEVKNVDEVSAMLEVEEVVKKVKEKK